MRFLTSVFVLAGVFLAPGCAPTKIDINKTLTLDTKVTAAGLQVPAQKKAQKITVEFSSSAGDVTVRVFKESDVPDDDAMGMTPGEKALGGKRGKADTFTVDLPENTPVRVVVREHAAAKTDVTLKVTGAP